MAFETVTGYCWPQSVVGGDTVALHLSSPRGLPVCGRGRARRGRAHGRVRRRRGSGRASRRAARRGHRTAAAGRRRSCSTSTATWRSGYYEVVLDVDVDGKPRRSHAFFVVRPAADAPTAPVLLALSTNTWHAYNDFGGRNLYNGGTQVSLQRPMTPGYLYKPPGLGRRVTTTTPPDPQMAAHVGYLALNHLSPWAGSAGLARLGAAVPPVGRGGRLRHRRRHERRPRRPSRAAARRAATRCTSPSVTTSTGRPACATRSRTSSHAAATPRSSPATPPSGRCGSRTARRRDRPRRWSATRASFKQDPVFDTDRQAELTSIWSDHLIERPENHMTGVSFARGGYHRIGKRATAGCGRLHDPSRRSLDLRGHRPRLRRRARRGGRHGRLRVRRLRLHLSRRPALPDGQRRNAGRLRDPRHRARRALHAHDLGATRRQPERAVRGRVHRRATVRRPIRRGRRRASRTATPSSAPTRPPAGGVVVTSGSTDWAHGLAGRDPQVEQITRNILDRLGRREAPER